MPQIPYAQHSKDGSGFFRAYHKLCVERFRKTEPNESFVLACQTTLSKSNSITEKFWGEFVSLIRVSNLAKARVRYNTAFFRGVWKRSSTLSKILTAQTPKLFSGTSEFVQGANRSEYIRKRSFPWLHRKDNLRIPMRTRAVEYIFELFQGHT